MKLYLSVTFLPKITEPPRTAPLKMPFSTQEHQNWDDLFSHYNQSYQLVHKLNLSGTKKQNPQE